MSLIFLVGFLPALVFLTLDILLTIAFFPPARGPVMAFFALGGTEQFAIGVVILLLTFVSGMVILSLTPWMRQLMEGYHLPERLCSSLERRQLKDHDRLTEKMEGLDLGLLDYRIAREEWPERLKEARLEGKAKGPLDGHVSVALQNRCEALKSLRRRYELIPYPTMKQLFDELEEELKSKSADHVEPLNKLHEDFVDLLEYGHRKIETSDQKLRTELELRFAKNIYQLGPSRLANIAAAHREYGLQRYGMDTELIWLRMLKIAKADSGFYPVLEDAKTQLDFSVAATALLGIHAFLWPAVFVPALFWLRTPTPYPYLLVALIAVLAVVATRVFYEMVLQNYRTFTEAVRSAIDLYRFDLLAALHIPLPNDARKEKQLWEQLSTWTVREGDASSIQYQHEPRQDPSETDKPQ
jgi:hypothetical protein